MDADSDMGPLCNLEHWRGDSAHTERAIAVGATALAGGAAVGAPEVGYYLRP